MIPIQVCGHESSKHTGYHHDEVRLKKKLQQKQAASPAGSRSPALPWAGVIPRSLFSPGCRAAVLPAFSSVLLTAESGFKHVNDSLHHQQRVDALRPDKALPSA